MTNNAKPINWVSPPDFEDYKLNPTTPIVTNIPVTYCKNLYCVFPNKNPTIKTDKTLQDLNKA